MAPRSVTARVDRLEPHVAATWRAAWQAFSQRVDHHIPLSRLERIEAAGLTEELTSAFFAERGLDAFDEWLDTLPDDFTPDPDEAPDLTRWPSAYPPPPPEPPGAWAALEVGLEQGGQAGALAAVGLFALGVARAVREARS